MSSIWSYPDRGKWGNSKYRGNCSGFIYRDLFNCLKPSLVVDPCVGSGTSIEVAREMDIAAVGLDLHSGFNLLRDSILQAVGKEADLCVSHFPYGDMIQYSGVMYPGEHRDDLSRCESVDDFLEKSHLALLNQRDATAPGGFYATIIGDHRNKGQYRSYQAEFIARMPASELRSVIVKAQHNCVSDNRSYNPRFASGLPRIGHEYLLVWERPSKSNVLVTLRGLTAQNRSRAVSTWKSVVRMSLIALGGRAKLASIYEYVSSSAPERLKANPNWQPKIRQTLQLGNAFVRKGQGDWALA
jgi:hypothetical protein